MSDVKSTVVMLPSKQASVIGKFKYPQGVNKLCIYPKPIGENNGDGNGTIPQHLYFTSDEEIKSGDVVIYDFGMGLEIENPCDIDNLKSNTRKKIIATTDKLLGWSHLGDGGDGYIIGNHIIKGNGNIFTPDLPEPSKEFIEAFVKSYNEGNVITDVLVEYNINCLESECGRNTTCGKCKYSYKVLHVKNNTITIKKVKDSWSREEVQHLLFKFASDMYKTDKIFGPSPLRKWIEKNL